MAEQARSSSEARAELDSAAAEAKAGIEEAARAGKARASSFFEEQKAAAAERVVGFADALRTTASRLEEEDDQTSSIARRAADGMERLAGSLRDRDFGGFLHDAEDFARRSPAAFLGGSMTAGFLLARFLKSSGERRSSPEPLHAAREGVSGMRSWEEGSVTRPEPRPYVPPQPRRDEVGGDY